MSAELRCPTCRMPWRDAASCPRCGTDLAPLMGVAMKAWELREAARALLCAGDLPAQALDLVRAACRLHMTPQGQRLLLLALLAAGHTAEANAIFDTLLDR